MIQPIVQTPDCLTILGPSDATTEDVDEALRRAPKLVAADGGAARALELGHMPDAVIGDFDSLPHSILQDLPAGRLHRIAEQDSTDFEKCLARVQARLVLAVGFSGRRFDHALAVMNTLVRYPERPCVVIGGEDIVFAAPRREIALDLPIGTRLSLFPMSELRMSASGLRWPVGQIDFAPAGRIGTSNEVAGPVRLHPDAPGMLVILPRAALAAAIEALTGVTGAVRGQ